MSYILHYCLFLLIQKYYITLFIRNDLYLFSPAELTSADPNMLGNSPWVGEHSTEVLVTPY
jgi:hypothetical protein